MVADAPRDDGDGGDAVASASDGRACARAPWAGLVDFTARLERVFGWQLLAAMVSADFFIKGVVKHMISTTSLPYAQRYLKFSAQAFQRFEVLVSFPWMLKALIGLITDTTPLFGYKKRVYLTLFALAGTVSMVIIAKKKFGPPDALVRVRARDLVRTATPCSIRTERCARGAAARGSTRERAAHPASTASAPTPKAPRPPAAALR